MKNTMGINENILERGAMIKNWLGTLISWKGRDKEFTNLFRCYTAPVLSEIFRIAKSSAAIFTEVGRLTCCRPWLGRSGNAGGALQTGRAWCSVPEVKVYPEGATNYV